MNREAIANRAAKDILAADVTLLNDLGVSDDVMSVMAAEHAARCKALALIVEPSLGRALLLMLSGALLTAAKEIDAATVQEPELINV